MQSDLDRITESDTERALMAAVRGQQLSRAELLGRVPAFPLKIQIQTSSPCSASCVMCPWPDVARRLPQGRMEEALFDDLVEQLAEHPIERTSLFLMNEPLLDSRLEEFCSRVKRRVPQTQTVIYTNGERLDGARALALAAAGMDEVNISVVGFEREVYERTMRGIDFGRVFADLKELGRLYRAGSLGAMGVRVVGLDLPEALLGRAQFEAAVALPTFVKPLSNRAGNVDPTELSCAETESDTTPGFRACQRPFVKAYVLYNGDVCLCNCDWERREILGNLREQSLERIWGGERMMEIRAWHLEARLPTDSLCAGCDYPLT